MPKRIDEDLEEQIVARFDAGQGFRKIGDERRVTVKMCPYCGASEFERGDGTYCSKCGAVSVDVFTRPTLFQEAGAA